MPKIRILSDHEANQIAAGEVIERPVSVIKELLENSLDAGAKRIEIEFQNGGKSYMRIADDGSGMSPDEALLSLERHATSKIQKAADLLKVCTFGFRGEAIPSIASVSRFTLRTRTKDWPHGYEILVNAGKIIHCKDHGMTVGTQIEVANLFNSIPVRRKFMKTDNTEAAHIIYLVRLYAIAHPDVAFTLFENGKIVFKSLITKNLIHRVCGVWNQKLDKELIELDRQEGAMHLSGLISKPGVGRSTRQEMITFVNNRPVDSKTLDYALIESYHTYIPKGRYPIVFLFLEISPELVDVNVHPAKREVRFCNEALVRQFVITTILERLKSFNQELMQSMQTQSIQSKPISSISEPFPVQSKTSNPLPQPIPEPRILPQIPISKPLASSIHAISTTPKQEALPSKSQTTSIAMPIVKEELKKSPLIISSWQFIGHLMNSYGLFETSNGLVVMNFKKANQRVLYERIQKSFKNSERELFQPLLFPIPISLDPLTAAVFEEHLNQLNRGGLKIELFGRNFYRIEAVPTWLDPGLAEAFVRDIAALIREQGNVTRTIDFLHEKMAKLAVTETLKFDAILSEVEIDLLVQDLLACENPLICPRGTPTYFELSSRDLEKRFGGLL